jgi:hypothetical protein
MALTQNKYLTVTTSPDGNKQLVTTASYGDSEIDGLDEWEVSAGKLQPKSGVAPNGVSIATAATEYAGTGDDATGDFSNRQSLVEYDTDHFQLVTLGSNLASGQTNSFSGGWLLVGDGDLTDGSGGTAVYLSTGASSETMTIDFGSTTDFNRVRLMSGGSVATPTGWTVSGSADDISYDLLDTASGLSSVAVAGNYQEWFNLDDLYSYRYVRIQSTTTNASVAEIEIGSYDDGVHTSVDYNTGSGVANIASASLALVDESDVTVGDSSMNIAYSLDNGTSFSASITYGAFKALGELVTTGNLVIRHFLTDGGATLKSSTIDTTSSESLILDAGSFSVIVNAALVGRMSSAGYTFPDATVQATSIENFLANLPTSDPVVAGEAWSNSGVVTISAG